MAGSLCELTCVLTLNYSCIYKARVFILVTGSVISSVESNSTIVVHCSMLANPSYCHITYECGSMLTRVPALSDTDIESLSKQKLAIIAVYFLQ